MQRIIGIGIALIVAFALGALVRIPSANAPVATDPEERALVVTDVPDALHTESVQEQPITPQTYESPFGFSFSYETPFTLENSFIVLPPGKRIASVAAVRYVTDQDCSESGLAEHCRPFLENPAIAFGVIDVTPAEIVATHLDSFADFLEPVTIADRAAAQYYAGVEGRGVVTILVPLNEATQTLVIQYTYDELFDYAPEERHPDILDSEAQKQRVDALLQSLELR